MPKKARKRERVPVVTYDDYDKFEASGRAGDVFFSRKRNASHWPRLMIIRCPGCGSESVLQVRSPGYELTGPSWKIVSASPLTLHPSVHHDTNNGGCGWHGWVKNGYWQR